jgi:hypothetical protein
MNHEISSSLELLGWDERLAKILFSSEGRSSSHKQENIQRQKFATGYLYPLLHKFLGLPRHNHDVDADDDATLQACRPACTPFQAEIR